MKHLLVSLQKDAMARLGSIKFYWVSFTELLHWILCQRAEEKIGRISATSNRFFLAIVDSRTMKHLLVPL